MIIDSSALVAIIRAEDEAEQLHAMLLSTPNSIRVSAATLFETSIVIDRDRDDVLSRQLDQLLDDFQIEVIAFTTAQARIARTAYRNYGKGSGHPAQLNLGDCFAYALSKDFNEPLLFKGNDFSQTDIAPALP